MVTLARCPHCKLPCLPHPTRDECIAAMQKDNDRLAACNVRVQKELGERRLGLDKLRRHFRSGNQIPVERATIRAEEIAELLR